jgi:hypothetical protein
MMWTVRHGGHGQDEGKRGLECEARSVRICRLSKTSTPIHARSICPPPLSIEGSSASRQATCQRYMSTRARVGMERETQVTARCRVLEGGKWKAIQTIVDAALESGFRVLCVVDAAEDCILSTHDCCSEGCGWRGEKCRQGVGKGWTTVPSNYGETMGGGEGMFSERQDSGHQEVTGRQAGQPVFYCAKRPVCTARKSLGCPARGGCWAVGIPFG